MMRCACGCGAEVPRAHTGRPRRYAPGCGERIWAEQEAQRARERRAMRPTAPMAPVDYTKLAEQTTGLRYLATNREGRVTLMTEARRLAVADGALHPADGPALQAVA